MSADIARAARAATMALGSEEQRRDPLAWWCLVELLYQERASPSDRIAKQRAMESGE